MHEISVQTLKKKCDTHEHFILLDVRTKDERALAVIKASTWIPLDELEQRYTELDKNQEIIVHCHHGKRSEIAAAFLRTKGYTAKSLTGGIDQWSHDIDPSVATY